MMSRRPFQLIPFEGKEAIPEIQIAGEISREASVIVVRYEMTGVLSQVNFPKPVMHPRRKKGLWEATCFEFFVGKTETPKYWEFNLSPSGDWNVFAFDSYRNHGSQNQLFESDAFENLPFTASKQPDCFSIDIQCDLDPLVHINDPLAIGICAVVLSTDQMPSYWALRHTGGAADFHDHRGFLIQL